MSVQSRPFASGPPATNGVAPPAPISRDNGPGRGPMDSTSRVLFSFPSRSVTRILRWDHKFFGDQLVVYGDAMYQNVKTHNELAAPATGNFQTNGQITIAIPPRVPNPAGTTPLGGPTYAETGLTPGAFNPFNPFNQIISADACASRGIKPYFRHERRPSHHLRVPRRQAFRRIVGYTRALATAK